MEGLRIYGVYCAQYSSALDIVHELVKSNPEFAKFLEVHTKQARSSRKK